MLTQHSTLVAQLEIAGRGMTGPVEAMQVLRPGWLRVQHQSRKSGNSVRDKLCSDDKCYKRNQSWSYAYVMA